MNDDLRSIVLIVGCIGTVLSTIFVAAAMGNALPLIPVLFFAAVLLAAVSKPTD